MKPENRGFTFSSQSESTDIPPIFTAISNPHAISYFSVNVNNGTEGQSFNMTDSIVSYTALPAVGTDILFVNDFGWNDSADEITIDVNVSVPANETGPLPNQ